MPLRPTVAARSFQSFTHDPVLPGEKKNGNVHAMKTAIDLAGRLVIPREVRREAGLKPGMVLDVRWNRGVIEIEPAPLPVALRKRGRLLIAVPMKPVDALRRETVERTRRKIRRGGMSS